MIKNSVFLGCLVLSMAIHTAFFIAFPYQAIQSPQPKKSVEVYYEQSVGQKAVAPLQEYIPSRQEKSKLPKIVTTKEEKPLRMNTRTIQDFIKNEIFKETSSMADVKKPFTKKEDIPLRKSISMPNLPGETLKTPEYKNYYQAIREKIRKYAYYNYKKLQEGEVFLSFSLTSDGQLLDAKVNVGKSSKNEYLREIALKSVTDAAPYPEFPAKLKNNNKLSFNVIISFELK